MKSPLVPSLISQVCQIFVHARSVLFATELRLFWKVFPMNIADSIVTVIDIRQITKCSSPFFVALIFLSFPLSTSDQDFCFFPANFMSSTHTDENNPLSCCTKRHSQFGIFSQPCFNRIFSNCLSHSSPAKG